MRYNTYKEVVTIPNPLDITGMKFGYLTAIHKTDKRYDGSIVWLCQCDCGNAKEVAAKLLKKHNTLSCGCYRKEQTRKANTTHGMYKHQLYWRWNSMINRCTKPSQRCYKSYGGRGITVCDEWKTFEPFAEWALSHGYEKDLSLERIDVNGNYCPENCTWIPVCEQNKNRRPFKRSKTK